MMGLVRRNQDSEGSDSDRSLLEFALELREIIRDEAATQLASGRAEESMTHDDDYLVLLLEPQNPLAASLEIFLASKHVLTCEMGRSGMSIEIVTKDEAEIKEEVRSVIRGILRGRYAEQVKEGSTRSRIAAEWEGTGGWERAGLNLCFRYPRPDAPGWRPVTYEPY